MYKIDGPGATPDGHFTEGDPIGGVPATVVTDDFMNDVQDELLNILAAASITPAVNTRNQVLLALQAMFATRAGLPFRNFQVVSTTSTWTRPAGVSKALVAIAGGGGGGGGATSSTGAAGGGGGGGCTGIRLCDVSATPTVSVTIGTGGAGGIANNAGTAGNTSSFGSFITAGGGLGGSQSTGGSAISGGGGTASTGADFAIPGSAGRYSLVVAGTVTAGGVGGDSGLGKGAGAPNISGTPTSQFTGTAGTNGAGGSGGVAYNASATGGAGGAGVAIILT